MERRYNSDLEARVAMLLGASLPGSGTNGTYNTATSEHFNDAIGVPYTPTSGQGLEPCATVPIPEPGFGGALPYYRLPTEVEGAREEGFSNPPAQGSGPVMDSYISDTYWDRSLSQTPTLGSADSPPSNSSPSTPKFLEIQKAQSSRPPRASEVKRERSTCYCPHHVCGKTSKDGDWKPKSFTRQSDYRRHYRSRHEVNPEKFLCHYCTFYSTRADKVKTHWENIHKKQGKGFKMRRAGSS